MIDPSKIRNFVIAAHIDHGKSTLADRFLEITATIPKDKLKEQYLDQMDLERERGITIKLAPVTMSWRGRSLNLIDTPGHVDFSYEVSRSLSAVEGAILLVDATQGIEAQTLSNYLLAKEKGLVIIPVINKIDLPNAQVDKVRKSLYETFGFSPEEILQISAKEGTGVEDLLDRIVEIIPFPEGNSESPTKALIFDSVFDQFKGVIAYVRVFDGKLVQGEKIRIMGARVQAEALEIGYFGAGLVKGKELAAGEIGYLATGLKEVEKVAVGDTITSLASSAEAPLLGYRWSKPMVFAGMFPVDRDEFPRLKEALEKLKLNDSSLSFEPENSPALGFGVRAGFLGLLHMEIVQERLEREFSLNLIITSPTVNYKVLLTDSSEVEISNPTKLPDQTKIKEIREPWIKGSILTLSQYVGSINQLVHGRRGEILDMQYLSDKVKILIQMPLSEIVSDFYDKLKGISSGYASFDWELGEYKKIEAVKLEILVAKEPVDALSQIVPREKAYTMGKALTQKLKEAIPRQQFEVSLQAAIGGKIVAAEKIPPFRKDVTAKLYGGDRTRKDKLLDKQKKGKSRMKRVGNVDIPQEAFLSVLKI
ncbi:MAG: translation elongation factor 4 [Candidatus Woykebacteria bacterium]